MNLDRETWITMLFTSLECTFGYAEEWKVPHCPFRVKTVNLLHE